MWFLLHRMQKKETSASIKYLGSIWLKTGGLKPVCPRATAWLCPKGVGFFMRFTSFETQGGQTDGFHGPSSSYAFSCSVVFVW